MSEKTTSPWIDGDFAVLVLVGFLLIVLCVGEPDLLDALIYRISDGKAVPKSMRMEE